MLRVRVLEQAFIVGCSGGDDVLDWMVHMVAWTYQGRVNISIDFYFGKTWWPVERRNYRIFTFS